MSDTGNSGSEESAEEPIVTENVQQNIKPKAERKSSVLDYEDDDAMEMKEFVELQGLLAELEKLDDDKDGQINSRDLKQFASYYGRKQRALTTAKRKEKTIKYFVFGTIALGFLIAAAIFGLVIAGIELVKDFRPDADGVLTTSDGEVVEVVQAMESLSIADLFSLGIGELATVSQIEIATPTSFELLRLAYWSIGKSSTSNTTAYSHIDGTKIVFPQIDDALQMPILFIEGDPVEIESPDIEEWLNNQPEPSNEEDGTKKIRKSWTDCRAGVTETTIGCVLKNWCSVTYSSSTGSCNTPSCYYAADSSLCSDVTNMICLLRTKNATQC